MSINSAIAAGVSGLVANSSALSAISDNIANANTVGYKQNDTEFLDLVTTTTSNGLYSAGGVQAQTKQLVSQQGGATQTNSNTDLSIDGAGMFVVATNAAPTATDPRAFTRAGSFTVDASGNLENAAGLYLQGWPVSADGTVTVNPSDVNSLQTINVGDVGGTATPTTQVSVNANLNSTQAPSAAASAATGTATLANGTTSWTYTLPPTTPAANLTFTVKDSSGNTVYTETDPTPSSPFTWNGADNVSSPSTQLPNGGTYTLAITDASSNPVTPTALTASGAYDPTSNTANMASGAVTPDATISIPISDTEGGQKTLQIDLLKSSTPNQWYAELVSTPATDVRNGSGVTGQLAAGTLTFDANGAIQMNQSSLFNNSTTPSVDILASATTPAAGKVAWASGLGLGEQNIAFNLSTTPGGITQLASKSLTESIETNGTQFGNLDSVAIDKSGFVTASYSNGVSKQIAQVAIATFENEDGLKAISGDAYQVSPTSGSYNLKTPDTGGAGTISPSTLEASTVDLSTQFSDLITTQTAYSASSKVITTADQMLQSLISIVQ